MLTGKVAMVTGATGGLGPAVVRALADDGAAIVAAARNPAELARLREDLALQDERWLAVTADLTEMEEAERVVAQATERFAHIDVLAALAGGWRGGSLLAETDLGTLDWLLRINLVTAFNACHAILPGMVAHKWGRIIAIGARSAIGGQARSAAYAASKAALTALIQSIALETKNQGVTANLIVAATIDTTANRASMPDADYSRWVPPADIAAIVRFLCSDEAAAVSGGAIPAYGRA